MANVVEVVLQAKDQASGVIDKTADSMKGAAQAAKSLEDSLDIRSGLSDLLGQFKDLDGKLKESAEAEKQVAKETEELAKQNKEAEKSASAMGGAFEKLKGILVGYLGIRAFSAIVDNIKEAQDAAAQLDAAYAATGSTLGLTRQRLDDLSTEMQRTTRYSDDLVKSSESILLTFDNVRGQAFERTIKAAADLGARLGTDLPTAVRTLGRALQEPEQGLTALRRAGITFSDSQAEVIKALNETGRSAEAQNIILSEVERRFGGAAEAARNTLGGALDGLKNSFGDLLEGTDKGTAGAVASINELTKALSDPEIKTGIDSLITAISTLAGWAVKFATAVTNGVQNLAKGVANFGTGGEQTTSSVLQQRVADQEVRVRRAERAAQVRNTDAAREELRLARERLDTLQKAFALSKATYAPSTEVESTATGGTGATTVAGKAQSENEKLETAAQVRARILMDMERDYSSFYASLADMPELATENLDISAVMPQFEILKTESAALGETIKGIWQGVGQSIQSTLSDTLYDAKFSLKSLTNIFRRALADITSAIITSGISKALASQIGGGSSSSSASFFGSMLGGLFGFSGGGRTDGPAKVGEDGVELAVPTGGGGLQIYNRRQLAFAAGGGSNISFAPSYPIQVSGAANDQEIVGKLVTYIDQKSASDFQEFSRMMYRNGLGRMK